jgi:hypothetical protein
LAALNYEGWSCPYGQNRFGAVTEVWEEEQEEWTVGGWVKRIRKSDKRKEFWATGGKRRVVRQM